MITYLGQLGIRNPLDTVACGQSTDANAALYWGEASATPTQVLNDSIHRFGVGGVDNGTSVGENETELTSDLHLAYAVVFGVDGIVASLRKGIPVEILFKDDDYANPNPNGPYLHYSLIYRINADGSLQTANPFNPENPGYARDVAYSQVAIARALVAAIAISKSGVAAKPAPAPTPEDTMAITAAEAENIFTVVNNILEALHVTGPLGWRAAAAQGVADGSGKGIPDPGEFVAPKPQPGPPGPPGTSNITAASLTAAIAAATPAELEALTAALAPHLGIKSD